MCTLIYQNFASKFLRYAHFPANFAKFQIFPEQSIVFVKKRLVYEKAFIFDKKCDGIKIKLFAQVLSNLLKNIKIYRFSKIFFFDFLYICLSKLLNT